MTPLEQWKQLAKLENIEMNKKNNGRSENFGKKPENKGVYAAGRPRLSDIKRSKIAQDILQLAQKGLTAKEAARSAGLSVQQLNQKARRYQITFKGSNDVTAANPVSCSISGT